MRKILILCILLFGLALVAACVEARKPEPLSLNTNKTGTVTVYDKNSHVVYQVEGKIQKSNGNVKVYTNIDD